MNQQNNGGDSGRNSMQQSGESDHVSMYSRNPITGMGLNGDGVGGLKPKTPKCRVGNPVTGEGYRPGHTDLEDLRKTHRRQGTFSDGRP
ncbi:microtubule-associated protein Jupiter-like [Drosophila innubila]|uniref:microtubule-associated protein Jupiter-like n=1 Tax=Drosophila innubila TaxID=198719 RepID=UPI00148D05EC|nr:microtubule-associated protein Jupiter-like [Drosophila innubila]